MRNMHAANDERAPTVAKHAHRNIMDAHILIVEDNAVNLMLIREILKRADFKNITGTRDPREVETLINENEFDLILLDIRMPHLDGFDILELLEARRRKEFLPVIMMTANNEVETRNRALMKGANDFIVKPYDHIEATHRIHNLLRMRFLYREQADQNAGLESTVMDRNRELEETNKQLIRSRNFTQGILDNVPAGIFSISSEGRILATNPLSLWIFGRRERELFGQPIKKFLPELDPHDRQCIESFAEEREINILRPDGSKAPVGLTLVSMESDDHNMLIGCMRDLTQEKAAEAAYQELQQQLLQAQKMESLGQLAGGISHDFNNMISIIGGYAQLAERKIDDLDRVRGALSSIRETTERAASLTHQLLVFSRKAPAEQKNIDLSETLRAHEVLLNPSIGREITLKMETPDTVIPVKCDASILGQVLLNLVINARDAVTMTEREDGLITVSLDVVDTPPAHASDMHKHGMQYARISVSDNGTGIDEDTQRRIFEPFFTTKDIGKGTGLGLSMVYGSIQQHNGTIEVSSIMGEGTTFSVYLPVIDAPLDQDLLVGEFHGGMEGSPLRILLAEDEEDLRIVYLSLLEDMGHIVSCASDGSEALELYEDSEQGFDLLLTDIAMPGLDGLKLARLLKEVQPDLNIILMTGHPGYKGVQEKNYPDDAQLFLKPLSPKQIQKALTGIVSENMAKTA